VQDRLPPTLQGRVQLGSTHLTVVALLVAAALAVTAWWVVRADGSGTMLPAAAPERPSGTASALVSMDASATGSTASASAQSSASASATIVIDVAGKVRSPGIATLPLGSRVVDAIKAAGGVRHGISIHALNLARVLVDGEQILVGVPPPSGVAGSAASAPTGAAAGPAALVNLNSATETELETLPGVGPVTAQAILQWRTENGAFTSVDELLEVSGIGDATLATLAPFVTL
jgi:competence protein ComEA